MKTKGIFICVERELLERFTRVVESMGLSRSETIRRAMEAFIEAQTGQSLTSKMRGLVRGSKLTLRELEEAYYGV
ncbi:MAG: ribbon-helix-helix protein, CopG family [Thermoprotei archaeon]|nr:ribbon-helix-helix protein, CopG family [Thermoprotei archaeon]